LLRRRLGASRLRRARGRSDWHAVSRLLLAIPPLSAAATALTAEPLPHRIAPILTHTHPSHYRHEQECGQNAGDRRRSHPRPRSLRHDSMFVAHRWLAATRGTPLAMRMPRALRSTLTDHLPAAAVRCVCCRSRSPPLRPRHGRRAAQHASRRQTTRADAQCDVDRAADRMRASAPALAVTALHSNQQDAAR